MEVIGATPQRVGWQPVRPLEILSWLKTYNENLVAADRPIVTEFVAVDDRLLLQEQGGEGLRGATRPCSMTPPHCPCSLLLPTPLIVRPCLALGHFVHTRFISGLTERCAQRMINILSNPDSTAAPAPGVPLASLLPNGLGSASPSRPRLSSSLPPSPTPIHAGMSKWSSTAISSHAATPEPRSPTFSGPAKWAEAAAGASHELRATTMTPNERESKRGCDKSSGSSASVSSLAPASNARSSVYCAYTPWHRTLQASSNLPFCCLLPSPGSHPSISFDEQVSRAEVYQLAPALDGVVSRYKHTDHTSSMRASSPSPAGWHTSSSLMSSLGPSTSAFRPARMMSLPHTAITGQLGKRLPRQIGPPLIAAP